MFGWLIKIQQITNNQHEVGQTNIIAKTSNFQWRLEKEKMLQMIMYAR